ncbi:MAG: S41 family peptidase [Planctomycetota bacterium]
MRAFRPALWSLLVWSVATVAAAQAPQITARTPAEGTVDAPAGRNELELVFDRDMDTGNGFSIGRHATLPFPELAGPPRWRDARTLVLPVQLAADTEYALVVNARGTRQRIRDAAGTTLPEAVWRFRTGAAREAAAGPRIAELDPPAGATDLAAGAVELRVRFDRDMDTTLGYSFGRYQTLPFPGEPGTPWWDDARTIVLPAVLAPGTEYGLVLNHAGTQQSFRAVDGAVLPPTEWRFATGGAATPARSPAAQRQWNERALARLQRAVLQRYSYRDRTGTDWAAQFAAAHDDLLAAASTDQWVERAAALLAPARDPHLWFRNGDRVVPTFETGAVPNYAPERLREALPGLRQRNATVASARVDDDVGYLMVASFARERSEQLEVVQDVLAELRDCRALVLDVRPNGGGDERLAAAIAAWFVDGETVYAGHRFVDPRRGFGPVQERTIAGNTDPQRRFPGPVAVLMGPRNLSSCEAFLLMMKRAPRATLVGARSSGSSGNPQPQQLGAGVFLMTPSWQALRPDGTCFEGEGIAPDVEVAATPEQLRAGDPVLQKALELLREPR